MAIYDYANTSSDSTYTVYYSNTGSNCTSNTTHDGTVTWTIRVPPPRKLLVKVPKHWKQSRIDGFAGLVNEQTHTGWKVTALVRVQKLYDKSVERVTMEQFKTILLEHANEQDREKINAWFAKK